MGRFGHQKPFLQGTKKQRKVDTENQRMIYMMVVSCMKLLKYREVSVFEKNRVSGL